MKLPVVLAGPFLRRTEFDQVYIWIACSDDYEISAELFAISKENYDFGYAPVDFTSSIKSVRLGEKLFISLIKLAPKSESFPIDELFGYNLRFTKDRVSFDLGSLGLLSPGSAGSIVYGHLKYPSFYITERQKSKLLFGSCRKLHGKGEDSLAGADLLLENCFLTLDERPEALFLMGDQIYADDVAGPITPFLRKLGETISGKKENMAKIEPRLSKEPYKTGLDSVYGRQKIADELCRFSSRKASNHLMRFGEFAAMYLFSFNPELWELAKKEHLIKTFEEELGGNTNFLDSGMDMEDVKRAYDKQLADVRRFAASLPRVRRLLANIPSYMIFDDHDLTDDWNISFEWRQDVWNAPLGRHVIANGLSAYWAFQGWGNNPDVFDDAFIDMISAHLTSTYENQESRHNWQQTLWSFDNWFFTAPTYPQAIFLDTRTQRSFPAEVGKLIFEGPQLINELGWLQAKYSLVQCGWEAGVPLIVVSSVPFYGIGLIDSAIKKAAIPLGLTGFPVHTAFDMDSWKYNGKGFESFHKWITDIDPEYCLILSGDSHYAFSLKADALYLNGDKKTLYQFTASPLKNRSINRITSELLKTTLLMHSRKNMPKKGIRDKNKNPFHIEIDHDFTHETAAKELIDYHTLTNGSIIETENNLGLLTVSPEKIEKALVKYTGKTIVFCSFSDK